MTRKFGPLYGKKATFKHRGVTKTVNEWGVEPEPGEQIEIAAWNGKTVVVPQTITSISQGHVIPKDGGGTYVVLSDLPDFNTITELTAETDTGTPVKVNVIPRRQQRGHAKAINYMLPIDKATGFIKFEKGRFGHKYYMTKRPRTDLSGKGGYTKQQIADELGVNVTSITDNWIRDNGIYGKSENKPLEFVTGCTLWNNLVRARNIHAHAFQSNWFLAEAGYDYWDFKWPNGGNFLPDSASGESPFHPLLITSYGEGSRPLLWHRGENNYQNGESATWLCYQNVDTNYVSTISGFAAIYSHVGSLGSDVSEGGFYLQGNVGKTLYRVNGYDSHPLPETALKKKPDAYAANDWGVGGAIHTVGVYTGLPDVLIMESHFDISGFDLGYDMSNQIYEPSDPSIRKMVPPTGLAHGIYSQSNSYNTIILDNILSRPASHSYQTRAGGLVYGNVIIEPNIFGLVAGQGDDPATGLSNQNGMGHFGSIIGNLHTSAAFKDAPVRKPALNWGIDLGRDAEVFENVFMHWANPNDAAEIANRTINNNEYMDFAFNPTSMQDFAQPLDNNFIHRWFHPADPMYVQENAVAKGADPAVLNTRTVQKFAEAQMGALLDGVAEGDKANAYLDWLRTLTPAGRMEQLRLFKQFQREPWPGLHRAKRTTAGTSVFQPDLRFSGLDWFYAPNWTDEMVPGKDYKDNAQLRGAKVRFGIYTCEMATVDGEGSPLLECVSGRLTVDTLNNIDVVRVRDVCGQLYIKTATNVPTFLVTQGRLVFDCPISGKDLIIDNQYAQVFLGPDYTVSTGKVLDIKIGKQGYIGHKGTGTAALKVQSGGILRFRWHDYKDDRIRQFTKLERIQEDWSTPASTVNVTVTLDAGSIIEVEKGAAVAGSVHDLTGPGYTVVNNGATLPAGVAITGGKLVYTVPN